MLLCFNYALFPGFQTFKTVSAISTNLKHFLPVFTYLVVHCTFSPSTCAPKGRCKKNGFIWDFVPNIGPHPPTAHVWDKVVKKTFFFYNLWGLKAS